VILYIFVLLYCNYLRCIVNNIEVSYEIGAMMVALHSCTRMSACIRHGTFLILVCCVQDL